MSDMYRSFELRYFSQDEKANGETDFKGETSTLDTEQRVQFLNEYFKQAQNHFDDFDLDHPIIPMDEARQVLKQLKPQPTPSRRKRIILDEWKWIGYRGESNEERKRYSIDQEALKSITLNNSLLFQDDTVMNIHINQQDWRCLLEWNLSGDGCYTNSEFSLDEAVTVGIDSNSQLYYWTNGNRVLCESIDGDLAIKLELDFVNSRYNLYINNHLTADFVTFSNVTKKHFSTWKITGQAGLKINYIWGVGYKEIDVNTRTPFSIQTYIDENFQKKPCMKHWKEEKYDDGQWTIGTLPIVHGGERYAGEDLYLRKTVDVESIPPYAQLYIESLSPGGELYINGELVEVIKDEYMRKIDVTSYLKLGENLFALKVYSDQLNEEYRMQHSHTDTNTGWFAGRMHLDLLPEIYIEDVFSWTESIYEYTATQKVSVSVKAQRGTSSQTTTGHQLRISMLPWFPEDGEVCAETKMSISVYANLSETCEGVLEIYKPNLWSTSSPSLYKIIVELYNSDSQLCDDFVVTTGIRTISQEGGVFRINGKPEILKAPLLFGARPSLDKIATWEKCPPAEFYVEEMLMIRMMNGNGIRMSVHDEQLGGVNDPRICELADQLGLMLIWQTSAWIRETSATNLDLRGLASGISQVRNHCSIVIWQPSNHPSWKNWDMVMKVYRMIYETITAIDTSRLISPSADSRRLRPHNDSGTIDFEGKPVDYCDPIWTAPLICRGNMDYINGYGNEWSALRQWPNVEERNLPLYMDTTSYIQSFIDSKERAYFNFEHDETAGQPNWELHKGKPNYQVKGYEWQYEEGSIGRVLNFSEWKISQAWQAFSAYETIRKCLWLGYDGFSWCCLRGGGNTATYQKPIVDYYGQAKLAYYIHRMAFQDVLAGSGNVDVVYGPSDDIPVMVINTGEEKSVTVTVEIKSTAQHIIEQKVYENVWLPAGRSVTSLESFKPSIKSEGLYIISYTVS